MSAVLTPPASEPARDDRPLLWRDDSAPCGHCWGQRRILRPAANGEGLVPTVCDECGGVGRVLISGAP